MTDTGQLNPLQGSVDQLKRRTDDHRRIPQNDGSPAETATAYMREHDLIHPVYMNDLVKLVRDSYKYVSEDDSDTCLIRSKQLEAKVQSRTLHQFGYISEPVNHTWEKQYRHFKQVLRSGHFSINQRPYETLGDFVIDPRTVFLQNFDDDISYQLVDKLEQRQPTTARRLDSSDENTQETEKKLCNFAKREKECKGAGLNNIKQLLFETHARIIATRAGQPYLKHVQQCQNIRDEKKMLESQKKIDDRHMVRQELSHTDLFHSNTGGPVKLENVRNASMNDDDGTEARKAKEFCRKAMMEWKKEQKLKKLLLKLEYIYHILCSLYNIKARQLKSKVPLTVEVVMSLRRNPFTSRLHDKSKLASRGAHNSPSMESRLDIKGTASFRASGAGLVVSDKHHAPASPHSAVNNRKNSIISHTNAQSVISGVKRNSIFGGQLFIPSQNSKTIGRQNRLMTLVANQEISSKVETWEDLLNVGNKTKLLRLLRKVVPPWQIPIANNEPVKSTKEKDEKHLEKYHPESAVNRMQVSYLGLKERIVKNLKHDLEKVDRERIVKFRYKQQTMQQLEPLYEVQRSLLKQVTREAVRDPVLITEETIPWYETLIQEATQLGFRQDSDVTEYMSKIEKFLLEEISHISSVKEKLCLLTVSLPIKEICTPHVQYAIQFVLIDILDGNIQMLEEWLNYRKLYVIKSL